MLGEMAGKTENFIEQFKKVLSHLALSVIGPLITSPLVTSGLVRGSLLLKQRLKISLSIPPRHGLAELFNKQCVQSQCFAHITHRAAGSVTDHRGSESGPFAAVFFIDILNHFFSALVLKVHIYIRWLVALSGDKTFEQ